VSSYGDRSAFEDRPDYRVDIHRRRNRVTVEYGGIVIADTTAALLVDEQDHGLAFYIPRADVKVELAADPDTASRCPFKGLASYWRFEGDGGQPRCWSYDHPFEQVERLRGHVAFYQDEVSLRVWQAHPAVVGYERKTQGEGQG
jgi:uncharacterized protein (DUF427 family)